MTTAVLPDRSGSRPANCGWPLYQPTKAALPKTLPRSSPGIPSALVVRRAGREHDRVVKLLQFGDRHVLADRDVADEADVVAERGRFVAAADALDRLVIGRDAGADQAVGHRQRVEHVDPHIVAPLLVRGFGGVVPRGPRADDRDVARHAAFLLLGAATRGGRGSARMQLTDCSRWLSRNRWPPPSKISSSLPRDQAMQQFAVGERDDAVLVAHHDQRGLACRKGRAGALVQPSIASSWYM